MSTPSPPAPPRPDPLKRVGVAHRAPAVSVVVIFLDEERFLGEAVESVLGQTFDDWELLLVDDGSTDASTETARRYAEHSAGRVRYLDHPGHENRGMSATRNLGVAHARGRYVAFLDADDVWEPNKLAEQVAIFDAHPEVGMVCGTSLYWRSWTGAPGDEDVAVAVGGPQDRATPPPGLSLALYPLGEGAAPCPSSLVVRRGVLERVGGFEEHFRGANQLYEDQGFLAKVYLDAPVYVASACWDRYRQHPDSCVAEVTRAGRYHDVRRYFLEWFEDYLADHPAPPAVREALRRALAPYRRSVAARVLDDARRRAPAPVRRLWRLVRRAARPRS